MESFLEGQPVRPLVMAEVDVAFQMSILLSVAFVGYLVAAYTRQSVVIGEILVGLLVGPSVLGVIVIRDAAGALTSTGGFIQGLGLMGALVLLFVVGLEHRFADIFRGRYALIAAAGVVLPWIGGYGFATLSGLPLVPSLFIGTALTATSIAITANVLKELGRLHTDAGRAILGAAVIDDVLSLIALALTIQLGQGNVAVLDIAFLAGKAVAFILVGAILGLRVLQPLLERLDGSRVADRHPEVVFLLAINFAFVYSFAAELIGLSGIVGAFLAGVSLTATKTMRTKNFQEGAEYLTVIFAGIFFVSLGVLVDLRQVGVAVVPFILALTAIAMVTKFAGCAIPARILGLSWRDSALVGAGMAPRGEVALIVALIALTAGVVQQDVYVAVVVMSLLTTLATPPLLKRLAREAPHAAGRTARE